MVPYFISPPHFVTAYASYRPTSAFNIVSRSTSDTTRFPKVDKLLLNYSKFGILIKPKLDLIAQKKFNCY